MTESPCNRVCKLEGNVCAGCGRTKWEIKFWMKLEEADKIRIIERVKAEKYAVG